MQIAKYLLFLGLPCLSFSQDISNDSTFFSYLCKNDFLRNVINDSTKRVQICFSEFDGDSSRNVQTFQLGSADYFYPASTVKLPVAILALEKMSRLGIGLNDILKLEDDVDCGNKKYIELTNRKNLSFRTIIEEMIVVSDNYYYNCLYNFVTPEEINARLKELGFNETNIYRSFSGCDIVNHLKTNGLRVIDSEGNVKYSQASKTMNLCDMSSCYILTEDKKLGDKHEYKREILEGPYDFNYNLEIPLTELHEMMLRLIRPELFKEKEGWNLSKEDREFMIKCCAKFPFELKNVKYHDRKKYQNTWYKFNYMSDEQMISEGAKTISKLGLSYGFTTEVAYVLNSKNGVQFQLSVSIYTNKNKTVNDGIYEYEELARPFIATLTKVLTDYEKERGFKSPNNTDIERLVFD